MPQPDASERASQSRGSMPLLPQAHHRLPWIELIDAARQAGRGPHISGPIWPCGCRTGYAPTTPHPHPQHCDCRKPGPGEVAVTPSARWNAWDALGRAPALKQRSAQAHTGRGAASGGGMPPPLSAARMESMGWTSESRRERGTDASAETCLGDLCCPVVSLSQICRPSISIHPHHGPVGKHLIQHPSTRSLSMDCPLRPRQPAGRPGSVLEELPVLRAQDGQLPSRGSWLHTCKPAPGPVTRFHLTEGSCWPGGSLRCLLVLDFSRSSAALIGRFALGSASSTSLAQCSVSGLCGLCSSSPSLSQFVTSRRRRGSDAWWYYFFLVRLTDGPPPCPSSEAAPSCMFHPTEQRWRRHPLASVPKQTHSRQLMRVSSPAHAHPRPQPTTTSLCEPAVRMLCAAPTQHPPAGRPIGTVSCRRQARRLTGHGRFDF
ncbi:hypothetical protein B0H67DRAFT_292265 [Lasiosphaeris hirsuta]|uniref:Uncharacterized protein n=1 Tax=Lasiosphaeris hirsuta TaxID=260670 RepID=A0AA40A908_9PEZI|nr:hypothetical protein B0H67DRAFT_292265 [Lasiosphaeris hirsuta]